MSEGLSHLGFLAMVCGLYFGSLLWPALFLLSRRLRRSWAWFVGGGLLQVVVSSLIFWLMRQARLADPGGDGAMHALILFVPVNLFFLVFHGLVAIFAWQRGGTERG